MDKTCGLYYAWHTCYDMMQSEVHWASDYPLAIAIGYIIGNNIVKRNIKRIEKKKLFSNKKTNYKTNFTFALRPDYKAIGLRLTF